MCRAEFDKTVRPYVAEVRIGKQGIAFDRHELDAWADHYLAEHAIDKKKAGDEDDSRSERPAGKKGGKAKWGERRLVASTSAGASGTSTSTSVGMDAFAKALARARGKEPRAT
jgi:hypothetical protein